MGCDHPIKMLCAQRKAMTDLKHIVPRVDRKLLHQELNDDTFLRTTNKGNNEIYVVNQHNSPNTLQEIGRLREVTFCTAGGGTGLPVDLDEFDTSENCYEQLIVYSPEVDEIIGGYRFIDCGKIIDTDPIELSTAHYFQFSDQFRKEYLPVTIELGRSWIQPLFQSGANARKGLFTLDNLWDGLGAVTIENPHIKHYFGKVTMYPSYEREARDALLTFLHTFFGDADKLVTPHHPLEITHELSKFKEGINDLDFKAATKVLSRFVRERGETIPPLINSYMGLSPTMKFFGTAMNDEFGGVEESGILVTIADIYHEKKQRHLESYVPGKR